MTCSKLHPLSNSHSPPHDLLAFLRKKRNTTQLLGRQQIRILQVNKYWFRVCTWKGVWLSACCEAPTYSSALTLTVVEAAAAGFLVVERGSPWRAQHRHIYCFNSKILPWLASSRRHCLFKATDFFYLLNILLLNLKERERERENLVPRVRLEKVRERRRWWWLRNIYVASVEATSWKPWCFFFFFFWRCGGDDVTQWNTRLRKMS